MTITDIVRFRARSEHHWLKSHGVDCRRQPEGRAERKRASQSASHRSNLCNASWWLICHRGVMAVMLFLCLLLPMAQGRAASSIIIDNETGRILAEQNRNQQKPIATLAQVALVMTLLDWAKISKTSLDTQVTVPGHLPDQGAANPLGLQEGDRLTLRDLLYLSMLTSDTVAAETIADAVGRRLPNPLGLDAVGNFVSQMNALAAKLQMRHTLFLNPSGKDEAQTQPYSTAADLARLVRYAYSKPGLLFYSAQKERAIQVERDGKIFQTTIHNANTLLGRELIDGVKLGRTERAKGCIALTAEDHPEVKREGSTVYTAPRRIIVILLGSSDPLQEGGELMQRGWRLYQTWVGQGRPTEGSSFLE